MSRILVIGMGLPGFLRAKRHGGPGLRAAHLATAIAAAGHELLLLSVLAEDEDAPAVAASPLRLELVTEKQLLAPALRRRIELFAPDAVVGVTVYAASLAARLKLGLPLWADVFGDLMAEAQSKAARTGSDWSLVHFWTLLRGVLEEADRFSAVSLAQSHALVGQLGLAGRLSLRNAGDELVAVIPCAAAPPSSPSSLGTGRAEEIGEFRDEARRQLGLEREDFALLLSGGVNTWCDVDTVVRGVEIALQSEPRLRVLVSGGAIPGHDEASDADLKAALARIDASRPRDLGASRVRDLGWMDSSRLPALYAAADLALHIEKPIYERRLGAENRVVEWLAHGLPCATTGLSETGSELVRAGLAFGCRAGDAGDLAALLLRLFAAREVLREAGRRGREWALSERNYEKTAAPLLAWCAAPVAARDRDGARLLRIGLLSHPGTSVELLEAYVAELPSKELARRGLRWVWRRALARRFRAAGRRC